MSTLQPNELAFLALANEYCATMESAREAERDVFVASVLRMLPRIYIAASDLRRDDIAMSDAYVANALDEDYYEAVRMRVAELLGEDDIRRWQKAVETEGNRSCKTGFHKSATVEGRRRRICASAKRLFI